VIHEELIRHFSSLPEPQLSPGFSSRLRKQLEAAHRPRHRFLAITRQMQRWAPRVYWIVAAALVLRKVRPPALAPDHMLTMAIVGVVALLALQRALHPTSLTRVLRDALLR